MNKCLFLFSLLISISLEQHSGPCAISSKAEKYTNCRDKKPGDTRNSVCCYLEADDEKIKRCVEVQKIYLEDKDSFKKLQEEIKGRKYQFWLDDNYTGFEEYKNSNFTIREIDSLRCNQANHLNLGKFLMLAILILI